MSRKVFQSIGEVVAYATEHECHFPFLPAAIRGGDGLRQEIKAWYEELSCLVGPTRGGVVNPQCDYIIGIRILWEEEPGD